MTLESIASFLARDWQEILLLLQAGTIVYLAARIWRLEARERQAAIQAALAKEAVAEELRFQRISFIVQLWNVGAFEEDVAPESEVARRLAIRRAATLGLPREWRSVLDAQLLIAGVTACFQAVQTWIAVRDRKRAASAFRAGFREGQTSKTALAEAQYLATVVPKKVLNLMISRAEACWDKYERVLGDDEEFLPDDVDAATVAVRACICRELTRIKDLNGEIPPGQLTTWWEQYCEGTDA